MKPIVPRERADRDVDEAIAYYAKEAPHVVDDLIDASKPLTTQLAMRRRQALHVTAYRSISLDYDSCL